MTGNEIIKVVDKIINIIDYFDKKKDEFNIDKDILKNEEDSFSVSFKSEDNNNEEVSFDNIAFYEKLSDNFIFDFIDNENLIDEEEILNLSNNSFLVYKMIILMINILILMIKKDRGHLSLFTINSNNISQKLKKLLLSNKENKLHGFG